MIRATIRWLISSVALLFSVTVLTFLLNALAPGDAAKAILSGQTTSYTPEQYQQVRHELGIDRPLPAQYWHWLDRLLHGSLGTDLFSGEPITRALNERLGASLSIIVGTIALSSLVGIGIGVFSAVRGGLRRQAPRQPVIDRSGRAEFLARPGPGRVLRRPVSALPGHWVRCVLHRSGTVAQQPRASGGDAVVRGFGVHRPPNARRDGRRAGARLRHRTARARVEPPGNRLQARAAQCGDPRRHSARGDVRQPARRHGHHRGRVRHSGTRSAGGHREQCPQSADDRGRRVLFHGGGRHREPARRPLVRMAQSRRCVRHDDVRDRRGSGRGSEPASSGHPSIGPCGRPHVSARHGRGDVPRPARRGGGRSGARRPGGP